MTPPARRAVLLLLAFATLAQSASCLLIRATNNCAVPADVIIQVPLSNLDSECAGYIDGEACIIEANVQPGQTFSTQHDTPDIYSEDNCIYFTGKGGFE